MTAAVTGPLGRRLDLTVAGMGVAEGHRDITMHGQT